jgi:gamma-glutamyltranspeptidase/glutathione hydrolase
MADGRTAFFDFRERAPLKASRDMYLDTSGQLTRDSIEGWRAPGVPGTVSGLELAHRKLGTKSWVQLVRPAVILASRGFEVSYELAQSLKSAERRLEKYPESKEIFLRGGQGWQAGDRLVQRDLGRTLARIARYGSKGFYEGETARMIARQMEQNGGLITLEDLKSYQAVEREPLTGAYRGYTILTAPPPSSGGIGILQMLGVHEGSAYLKSG